MYCIFHDINLYFKCMFKVPKIQQIKMFIKIFQVMNYISSMRLDSIGIFIQTDMWII
jgi:hypothetical protein